MGIIESMQFALRSRETIFLKKDTNLEFQYNALKKLNLEYPNNKDIQKELYMVKKRFRR